MAFDFVIFWKRYGDPVVAISILIFIVFSVVMIMKDRDLKKEINENCGWGEEDYKCFCEKSKAMEIENKMKTGGFTPLNISGLNFSDVQMDR
jgi:hypothetical protein